MPDPDNERTPSNATGEKRRRSANGTICVIFALLGTLAYWAGSYKQLKPKNNPRDAVPLLVYGSLVFGVRAIMDRIQK
jgi:hypothetical protein